MTTPATTEQCHQDTTKMILRFDTWKENEKLDMQQKRTPETTESKLNNEIHLKGNTEQQRKIPEIRSEIQAKSETKNPLPIMATWRKTNT
ncbi:1095_t:CDS:2 [Dentiscutata erythropus]|uniref:1095_t:CDS:1 n=1 Tax=Dentiscutata erythropus TaxID=1348616 RepID=A0A9N9HMT8_9GLOM|nr:1095_t:CDS:2 [Dentiscutata erythropus]